MKNKKPRVRFAPSPTGELHVGNARTALFNWLFARRYCGDFILRIEDTDESRSDVSYQNNLYEDLKWLSLFWDEGPEKGGSYGPYKQSERLDIYKSYLDSLIGRELVYPCYCTEEELEEERQSLILSKRMPRYMGKCRNLTKAERDKREREGRRPSYRFKIQSQLIEFEDIIKGKIRFDSESIGDFIIMRSSGAPAYNFAAVIDDYLMAITHVIRGEDHLSNTALQLMLYKALEFTPPFFAHHSLIFGKDHAKLGKRHGSVSISEFRKQGILPEALTNYLGLLGISYPEKREILSLEEMVEYFSLEKISKSGAIFDEEKLFWLNSVYIKNTKLADLVKLLQPFLKTAGFSTGIIDEKHMNDIVELIKPELVRLSDIPEHLEIFFDDKYKITGKAVEILSENDARRVIRFFAEYIKNHDDENERLYSSSIKYVKEKTKKGGKDLFMPIRAALTGKTSGPPLDRVFVMLKKDSILKRLNLFIR